MEVKLKRVRDQVMVITGASSGIGLATAQLAADRGARLMLTARNEEELQRVTADIRADGGEADWLSGDIADLAHVEAVAERAIELYGRIDTWINNAGISIFGRITEVPTEDARRLFETNYWGVVNGSLTAVHHMRESGGALINIGSVLSDRAVPLQGHYSASKHAVRGFTDAVRTELEHDNVPISVTLVKPTSIDTPYPQHARNYMDAEPKLPSPVYAPDVVAKTILACAERPARDILVGGAARMMSNIRLMPRVADQYMDATMFDQQQREDGASTVRQDSLYAPGEHYGSPRGEHPGYVMKSSLYTTAAMHPFATAVGTLALVATLKALRR
jgi:short-subunit dehydrogenase